MTDCLFCKIVRKEINASVVYEDENLLAFKDISPKAPVHVLVIPKLHLESLLQAVQIHQSLLGDLTVKLALIAKQQGLAEGFKIAINTGTKGGQEVMHLHYHLTGNPS